MTGFEAVVVAAVVLLFSGHMFLDIAGILPRIAGTRIGRSNLGYSFQIIVMTFKRVLAVSYPPIMGLLIIKFSLPELFLVVAFAYTACLMSLLFASVIRARLLHGFECAIQHYTDGASTMSAIFVGFVKAVKMSSSSVANVKQEFGLFGPVDHKLVPLGTWVVGVYSVSMFTINLIGSAVPQYASIVLQCGGLINAFGTIVMAFFYDPRVSKALDDGLDQGILFRSIVLCNLLSVLLFAPIYFSSLFFILT